jgi:hypothetical protein
MLVALGLSKIDQSQNQAAKQAGVSRSRVSYAVFIIENAPDQVDLVITARLSGNQTNDSKWPGHDWWNGRLSSEKAEPRKLYC